MSGVNLGKHSVSLVDNTLCPGFIDFKISTADGWAVSSFLLIWAIDNISIASFCFQQRRHS